ncbi:hypothetical protein HY642_00890 [Candidatus Woesearchaeota archaeon]|nr:hypothetical protein [Candidatus Woesearchaeota archaeon]
MKKAQGLSINTIIITILALLVLVVIAAIFTGRIGIFGKGVATCPGACYAEGDTTPNPPCDASIGQKQLYGNFLKEGTTTQCKYCCSTQ